MTNFEKYKEEIKKAFEENGDCGIRKFIERGEKSCPSSFYCFECRKCMIEWFESEYKEPAVDWSKVKVDTPILVNNDGALWMKRYFAKYEGGKVFYFLGGATSWSNDGDDLVPCDCAKLAEEEKKE